MLKKIILGLLLLTLSIQAEKLVENIYDLKIKDISGQEIKLEKYKNKVLLIVNVASKCAFTYQYEDLQKLYKKYKNDGFMVLGFPSNEFLEQEPGTNEEIKTFCRLNYDITFDMFSKITINGDETIPLYKYLKENAKGIFGTKSIKWNFTKFLINKKGEVIKRYGSSTKPFEIEDDILKLLK